MAQPLQNITITAPAFKGLNTQDSPLSGDPQYASIADNVVIDSYGRIGTRKGIQAITTDNSELSGLPVTKIHEQEDANGNISLIAIGNGKILNATDQGSSEYVDFYDMTPSGYSFTTEDFTIVRFNDNSYFFNEGNDLLVHNGTDGLVLASSVTGASTFIPDGGVALSAFGRLWATDSTAGSNTVYWSDLLVGHNWSDGSSGSVNLDKVWPDGSDAVTGLASWNGLLVIFGRNSIVLYQNPDSPANMSLADTVTGVGCIDKNTIQATGNDLLFLSFRGLMALGRTIQEKSNPLNDVSRNVRNDLVSLVAQESLPIQSAYVGSEGFYLLILRNTGAIYCFDTKGLLENGSYRVTRWIAPDFYTAFTRQDDTLLIGNTVGLNEYAGYSDNGESFTMRYYSNPLSFGDPSHIKFVKKLVPTIIGGSNDSVYMKWSYDFNSTYNSQGFSLATNTNIGYYGVGEFSSGLEFVSGNNSVTTKRINTGGSGNLVTVGLESEINGTALSLQELNIQATIGKTY